MNARALPTLPRGWWGVELSGYRTANARSTYVQTPPLPPIERDLDNALTWLMSEPVATHSLADNPASPRSERPPTG